MPFTANRKRPIHVKFFVDEHELAVIKQRMAEFGYAVSVKEFVCSAETYTEHPVLGHFHPIQMYYVQKTAGTG